MAKYVVSRSDGTPISDDEPCFIIRAQDILATEIVNQYIILLLKLNMPEYMIEEAEKHVQRITDWQDANRDKVKIPD